MKINELRLGNWINSYHGDVQVTRLALNAPHHQSIYTTPNRIGASSGCIYTPIELTDQWFKDFSFKETKPNKEENGFVPFELNGFKIYKMNSNVRGIVYELYEFRKEIKYVHQIQNLYFSLTGKELIKK